jgi:hypothetical protein
MKINAEPRNPKIGKRLIKLKRHTKETKRRKI